MSYLQHTTGNLIDLAEQGEFDIIVHGCNCKNVMGAGIAKEIKDRHPLAYRADTNMHKRYQYPVELLGNYSHHVGNIGQGGVFTIVNAYTQLNPGPNSFDYEAFDLILKKLFYISPGVRYGFPYIGMGLAGGNALKIMTSLELFATRIAATGGTVTLVEYKP